MTYETCLSVPRCLYYLPLTSLTLLLISVSGITPNLRLLVIFLMSVSILSTPLLTASFQRHTKQQLYSLFKCQTQLAIHRERAILAVDLHDTVIQLVFATSLITDALLANEDAYPRQAIDRLTKLHHLTVTTHTAMRHILLGLQPTHIDEIPFEQLVAELIQVKQSCTDTEIQCLVTGTASYPTEVHRALYKIVNLALSNSVLHAQASYILVRLFLSQNEAIVSIEDNGVGFDPALVKPGHFGLENMHLHAQDIEASLIFSTLPNSNPKKVTCIWSKHTWEQSRLS